MNPITNYESVLETMLISNKSIEDILRLNDPNDRRMLALINGARSCSVYSLYAIISLKMLGSLERLRSCREKLPVSTPLKSS